MIALFQKMIYDIFQLTDLEHKMMKINFDKFLKNLMYVIKESLTKLGYTYNEVTINYPVDSLNRLFETQCTEEEMAGVLAQFADYAKKTLGEIRVAMYEGQYRITVSADGAKYVHENVESGGFVTDLIELFQNHLPSIDDVVKIFGRYSDAVVCKELTNDEFNYVVYFADGVPDNFMYCIDIDEDHATYHRLTPDDYYAFGFEE